MHQLLPTSRCRSVSSATVRLTGLNSLFLNQVLLVKSWSNRTTTSTRSSTMMIARSATSSFAANVRFRSTTRLSLMPGSNQKSPQVSPKRSLYFILLFLLLLFFERIHQLNVTNLFHSIRCDRSVDGYVGVHGMPG